MRDFASQTSPLVKLNDKHSDRIKYNVCSFPRLLYYILIMPSNMFDIHQMDEEKDANMEAKLFRHQHYTAMHGPYRDAKRANDKQCSRHLLTSDDIYYTLN